jgi:hypothetical protein
VLPCVDAIGHGDEHGFGTGVEGEEF